MPKITYVQPDGVPVTVDAVEGDSVMTTAVDSDVQGILGECGGGMSCGTCHVVVDAAWCDVVGPAEDYERGILATTATPATERSRLSCQIFVDDACDGLVVQVVDHQN